MSCSGSFRHGEFDVRDAGAGLAAQHGLAQPDLSEDWVGPGADAAQCAAAAMAAHDAGQWAALQRAHRSFKRLKAKLMLVYFRTLLCVLRLQIVALALQGRLLRLDQPQLLAKYRRRAVFVDQFLDKFEWSHGWPLRLRVVDKCLNVAAPVAKKQEAA